jgi:predicted RNase H-like HicB family nuclease
MRNSAVAKSFTLQYWRDGGWYVGRLWEVPGVFSQGRTVKELDANVREAYDLMIEDDARPIRPSANIPR